MSYRGGVGWGHEGVGWGVVSCRGGVGWVGHEGWGGSCRGGVGWVKNSNSKNETALGLHVYQKGPPNRGGVGHAGVVWVIQWWSWL